MNLLARSKVAIIRAYYVGKAPGSILSDPNKFGSDIWLSTTSCSFHTHSDDTKSLVLRMSTYTFIMC